MVLATLNSTVSAGLGPTDDTLRTQNRYVQAQREVDTLFAEPTAWAARALRDIAGMGRFGVDRTIRDDVREVWGTGATWRQPGHWTRQRLGGGRATSGSRCARCPGPTARRCAHRPAPATGAGPGSARPGSAAAAAASGTAAAVYRRAHRNHAASDAAGRCGWQSHRATGGRRLLRGLY